MMQSNLDLFPGWQGHLQLIYRHHRSKTQAIEHQGIAPAKVQRSFYPKDKAICHNTILHTASVIGGDRLEIDIDLQPQSRALITPASQQIVQNISVHAPTI